jgi:lysozyme
MTAALKTTSYIIAASRDLLQRHEGRRQFLHYDTRGKLTIAVGRNHTDRSLADDEIGYLFANDLIIALKICQDFYPSFASFTPARQAALISMAFNLGKPRLAGFWRMHAAINRSNWQGAADEAEKSLWALQTRHRATDIAISPKNDLNRCP